MDGALLAGARGAGDEAADPLIEYAAVLASHGRGDSVTLRALSSDGDESVATLSLPTWNCLAAEAPDDPEADALTRADADGLVDVAWAAEDTPIGTLTLAATRNGLVRIGFGHDDDMLTELASRVSPRVVHLPARLDDLRRQLDEYFAGRRRSFDVWLDRRLSRGYRLAVLEELSRVPFGETVSYKDLAVRTGHPTASRAVGTAMATNPIPIVVPCHRVLRTGIFREPAYWAAMLIPGGLMVPADGGLSRQAAPAVSLQGRGSVPAPARQVRWLSSRQVQVTTTIAATAAEGA